MRVINQPSRSCSQPYSNHVFIWPMSFAGDSGESSSDGGAGDDCVGDAGVVAPRIRRAPSPLWRGLVTVIVIGVQGGLWQNASQTNTNLDVERHGCIHGLALLEWSLKTAAAACSEESEFMRDQVFCHTNTYTSVGIHHKVLITGLFGPIKVVSAMFPPNPHVSATLSLHYVVFLFLYLYPTCFAYRFISQCQRHAMQQYHS